MAVNAIPRMMLRSTYAASVHHWPDWRRVRLSREKVLKVVPNLKLIMLQTVMWLILPRI